MFMHSVYHKYASKSFNTMFTPSVQIENRNLRTDNLKHFNLPFPRTDKFKKSPTYLLLSLCNLIDANKLQSNRFTFGYYLKNQLIGAQAV